MEITLEGWFPCIRNEDYHESYTEYEKPSASEFINVARNEFAPKPVDTFIAQAAKQRGEEIRKLISSSAN